MRREVPATADVTVGIPMQQNAVNLPKIFLIGFNKCGTQTIHHFFQANGYKSVHYDRGRLARTMYQNLTNGFSLVRGYEEFHVYTDMECIANDFAFEVFKLFPLISEEFPDAIYILQTRNVDNWIRSRFNYGNYSLRWKKVLNVETDEQLAEIWRQDWHRHHQRVIEYFGGHSRRFVKFDIENDPTGALVDTLPEYRLDARKYAVRGKTTSSASGQIATAIGLKSIF